MALPVGPDPEKSGHGVDVVLPAAYAEQLAQCSLAVDEQIAVYGSLTTTAVKDLQESPQKPPTPPPKPTLGARCTGPGDLQGRPTLHPSLG